MDDRIQPAHAMLAHARAHPFAYLSLALHAALFAVLCALGSHRSAAAERVRQQQSVDAGARLTEQGRLEKRVHDMAQIKSLLEQSTGAQSAPADDDDQFSTQPRATGELLKRATALAQKIEDIERVARARELARLLAIPPHKAMEQVAPRKPDPVPGSEHGRPRDAAAQIEQLEAKARAALARRRRQLAQRENGTQVTTGKASVDPNGQPGRATQDMPGAGNTGGAHDALLDRMAAFTNRDLPEAATKAYAAGGMAAFFDSGVGHIPGVGMGTPVKGAGNVIGRGGAYANRVYVNRWYLIGPFQGRHGVGLFANDRHPPEQAVVLDAAYRGKDGRLLKWNYVDMASYPLIPPDPAEDAVYYGFTELMLDRERDLTVWVGADDDAQLWLNDRLVWRGGNVNKEWFFGEIYGTWNSYVRDYNLTEGKHVQHFRKGRNKLFFKLANGPTRVFFSLVLTQ